MRRIAWIIALLITVLGLNPALTQDKPAKPFILPIVLPPGPSTWFFGQAYGNTVGAFNSGKYQYAAGQGLHFGIDLAMPCKTALVAVGDGVVAYVDNLGFGAGPHNLLIKHPDVGVITLYGHLFEKPPLKAGDVVRQGQYVALSGDPDNGTPGINCNSRPHLHFEIRSLTAGNTLNPLDYINADWNSLSTFGAYGYPFFEQDLSNPRRWMNLFDQPDVTFGGAILNDYRRAWPPSGRPPSNPPMLLNLPPLPADTVWTPRALGTGGCCSLPWWRDAQHLNVIDGAPGQRAQIFDWQIDNGALTSLGQAPPPFLSPDGSYQVYESAGAVLVRRLSDGAEWRVPTSNALPAISTDNSRLLWMQRRGSSVPGQPPPAVTVWVSDIMGNNPSPILTQKGGGAIWLDAARLLVTTPSETDRTTTTLSIVDTRDNSSFVLGTWTWLRGVSIAPGGGRLLFYLAWQADSSTDGVYTQETQPGAVAQHLSWFGAWRWRDADSLYYLPFASYGQVHYYQISTGEDRSLTDMPIHVANADWSVSPDGQRIAFQNADDLNTWLLEAGP